MTKGRCNYRGKLYSKAGMTKHLASCEQRKAVVNAKKGRKKNYFHIIAEDKYSSDYWMHLKILDEISLFGLDLFLKDVWVEWLRSFKYFHDRRHYLFLLRGQ